MHSVLRIDFHPSPLLLKKKKSSAQLRYLSLSLSACLPAITSDTREKCVRKEKSVLFDGLSNPGHNLVAIAALLVPLLLIDRRTTQRLFVKKRTEQLQQQKRCPSHLAPSICFLATSTTCTVQYSTVRASFSLERE